MVNQIYEEIKKEFSDKNEFSNNSLTDSIIKELVQYCEAYCLTPKDLSDSWETFIVTNPSGISSVNEDVLDSFRNELQNEFRNNKKKSKQNSNLFSTPKKEKIKIEENIHDKNDNIDDYNVVISKFTSSGNKRKIQMSDSKKSYSSPGRSSQNNILSPSRSNVMYSPTKYRNISKNEEISSMTKKFLNRQKVGVLDEILNNNIKKPNINSTTPKEFSIFLLEDQIQGSYRYMYTKLDELGEILNDRIDSIFDKIKEYNKIDEEEVIVNPHQILNEEFITGGRICYDIVDILDAANVKNNENSVLIEPSQKIASGHKVKLNFSKLASQGKSYTLFPGQILGIKGTNPTGKCIEVSEILEPPSPPIPTSTLNEISQYYSNSKGQPLSVFVAAGPYTCEDSLNYEPLNELFEKYIIPEKPDVLILMGPFVDDRHPKIQNGQTIYYPEEIFCRYIAPQIAKFYEESPNSKIIIIPSNNDIITNSVCFPQPPLDAEMVLSQTNEFNRDEFQNSLNIRKIEKREKLGLPLDENGDRIFYYPNPVQFQINDIVFAISNNDILNHLSSEEVSHFSNPLGSPTKGYYSPTPLNRPMDKISRLTRHLLQQHSFYPLFPPLSNEANIIYEQSEGFDINIKPDVLILNSALRRFAKIVDNIVCINPGQVVHKIAGTFSKLYIYPLDPNNIKINNNDVKIKSEDDIISNIKKEDSNNDMQIDKENEQRFIHEVSERCRVEIQRV